MKRFIFFLVLVVFITACNQNNVGGNLNGNSNEFELGEEVPGGIQTEIESFNLGDAVGRADLVAEVIIKEKVEEVKLEPVPYTVFKAEVIESYQGNAMGEIITIIQEGDSEWSVNNSKLFEGGEQYIFFLKEAKASKSDYWILGGQTGFFQVLDGETIAKLFEQIAELKDIEVDNKSLNIRPEMQILNKQGFIEKIHIVEGGN